ncbi:MAG TPA: hypothetical protein VMT70_13285 [Vicinamibacteria bacterium]|nr:hypothetical protein [Vicinamibacteria bacterium]
MKAIVEAAAAGVVSAWALAAAGAEPPPQVKMPEPGVPQIMTLQGRYVRAAYNNEGYVILGYRIVNLSVGEPWMLLEVGFALRDGVPDYALTRDALSLSTPDGKTIPLPSVEAYRKANLDALKAREKVQRDSINYFPPNAYRACRIGFFADLEDRALPWDKVELTSQVGCVGRLFFAVPGGIAYGQHWLNVKFAKSLVRVPFRVLTKAEDEHLEENFGDIKKQVDEAFKKKTKS